MCINVYAAPGGKSTVPEISLKEAITGAVTAIETALPGKTEIALAGCEASPVKLASYLNKELSDRLKTSGKLNILAQGEELETLINELNFQVSGYVSDDSIVSNTKMLGVKSMVFGSFDDLGAFYQYRVRVISEETRIVQVSYSARVIKKDKDIAGLLGKNGNSPNDRMQEEAIASYNRGIDNMAAGAKVPAIEEFSKAIKTNPKFTAAFIRRGLAYYFNKENAKAKSDFDSAIKLDKNNPLAYLNRGVVQSDSTGKIADYTKAIEIDPDYMQGYIYRGEAYEDKKDYDHAIADYTSLIKLRPKEISFYYQRAYAYRMKKDYYRMIADYKSVIRLKPDDKRAYFLCGDYYYFTGRDYKNALTAYADIINRFPNDASAYFMRGRTYYELEEYDKAMSDCEKTIKLDPNFVDAYVYRSLIFSSEFNDDNKAIACLTDAIKIDQNKKTEYKLVSSRLSYLPSDAIEDDQINLVRMTLSVTIFKNINTLDILYNYRGTLYQKKGDNDAALRDYSEAIKIDPKNTDALFNRGNIYHNIKKDYDKAIIDFGNIIKIDPKNIDAITNRAYSFRGKGLDTKKEIYFDIAIIEFSAALKIDPKNINALLQRGMSYINKGPNFESNAHNDWNAVLKIDPNNSDAKEWLAERHWW